MDEIDMEKVIKGLEICSGNNGYCSAYCPYNNINIGCKSELMEEAITLLKEQEEQIKNRNESLEKAWEEIKWLRGMLKEQEPILLENQHKPHGISTNANSPWISRCPRCGKKVEGKQTKFCKYCG